ncbi:MAG: trypsin-like peptidase domain-containing protein [Phycisphaerales bacterium]
MTHVRCWSVTGLLAIVGVGAFVAGSAGLFSAPPAAAQPHARVPPDLRAQPESRPPAPPTDELWFARALSGAFQSAAEKIGPSVVHINQLNRVMMRRGWFEEGEAALRQTGLGSGVVVRPDGYILTNYHVIANAEQLEVTIPDRGRALPARIVGVDRPTDLAVLKVDAAGLTPAVFGDSDALQVGEWVLAAGSPYGFDNTVTAGIISATGRGQNLTTQTDERYDEFIQTDAAINPGNSGGPLVNLEGQVVGINNQIATRTGGSVGLGFAISSSIARPVMESLIRDGRVERGWLGVEWRERPSGTAGAAAPVKSDGVVIEKVVDGSPAALAGLLTGDIVTRFNGRPTTSGSRFRSAIAFTQPGEPTPIEIVRGGEPRTVTVELVDRTTGQAQSVGGKAYKDLGVAVATLSAESAKQLGYPLEPSGVVIIEIDPESPAAQAGLEERDVIVAVGNRTVATLADFDRAIGTMSRGDVVRFGIVGLRREHFNRGLTWQRGHVEIERP